MDIPYRELLRSRSPIQFVLDSLIVILGVAAAKQFFDEGRVLMAAAIVVGAFAAITIARMAEYAFSEPEVDVEAEWDDRER